NGDTVTVESSDGILSNLRQVDAPDFAPDGLTFPNGFFAFDVEGVPVGGTVTVEMTLPTGSNPTRYVKCTSSACSEFAGASIAGDVVTLTLRDGGEGDADGAADGHIQDPGAPAQSASGSDGGGGGGGGAFDWMTLGALALLALGRRRWGA
ncbi:MAG TPA: choice-of-anchor U domain-containing protein, partial [Nevskiaceae bacterium]|nr:choice-of-anchor U domain-containing protein [Nevskiaceae bacterium]